MKTPQYEFKTQPEGVWAAVGIVVGFAVARIFDVPVEVAVACGVLARPIFGYAIGWLPRPKAAP